MPRGEVRGFDPAKLRARRNARGYTLEVLADLVGMSHQTLIAWEGGHRSPTARLLIAVAESLGATIGDFITRDETSLRDLRADADLSRDTVSAAIRRSPVTLGQFEKGRKPLHDDDVEYLAALYKVTPEQVRAAAKVSAAAWQQRLDEARNSPEPKSGAVARAVPTGG